jgi:hypothetical protein
MRIHRLVAVGLGLAGSVLAVGCSAKKAGGANDPLQAVSSASAAAPIAAAGSPTRATATATGTGTSTAGQTTADVGCPVTADTLFTALKKNNDIYGNLAQPVELETPTCYHGYATAQTKPVPNLDPATVVFSYNATAKSWAATSFGSADFCTGKVPADVIPHLPACGG